MEMKIVGNTMKFDFTRNPEPICLITEHREILNKKVNHAFKKYVMPAATFCSVLTSAMNHAMAATSTANGISMALMPLIAMIRDLALPVGIAVSSWGLVEIMIGNLPSGKQKLKFSIIGFIGMYVIPAIFYAIRQGFGTSVLPIK